MPGVLVDSSVVLDLFTNDPIWGERSAQALAEAIDGALFTLAPFCQS